MTPLSITQVKLEQILTKISLLDNPNTDIIQFGDFLLANILVCKEINLQKDENIKTELWNNIKDDFEEIIKLSQDFLKSQNIT